MSGSDSGGTCSRCAGCMVKWTIMATVFQLAMVVVGHYVVFVKENVFAIGGMLISLVFGALWARAGARSAGHASLGGGLVGGICALIGIGVCVALGDTEAGVLLYGTAGSLFAGVIGGVVLYAVGGSKSCDVAHAT